MTQTLTDPSLSPRERIIHTAIRLFFEQGYMATGTNQIIQEAGVCKATFYGNFPSKEDLCLVYIEESHNQWMARLTGSIGRETEPLERLLAVFTFLEEWMTHCDYRGCGLMNIASEIPDVRSRLRDKVQERNRILKDAITQLVQNLKAGDERYRHVDVPETADYLFLIIQGAVAASQGSSDLQAIKSAKSGFVKLLNASIPATDINALD